MPHLTFAEALVIGLVQGVTELFPVSSLGHSVLIPALIGGSWAKDLNVSAKQSPYLAFIVGMHVATALAMIAYFWRDWLRIVRGFVSSVASRRMQTNDQRLAWMIIFGTVPVGIAGVALQSLFRGVFSRPIPTALFLAVNGLVLFGGERLRRRSVDAPPVSASPVVAAATAGPVGPPAGPSGRGPAGPSGSAAAVSLGAGTQSPGQAMPGPARHASGQRAARRDEVAEAVAADGRITTMSYRRAIGIGAAQIFALLPGISRDGIVMVTGMLRGLSREDAARFSFLLSAPVIMAAGVLKLPDLMGPLGNGIRGQVLAGSLLSGIGAYVSLRFLMRYFKQSRTLTPFAIYCLVAGLGSLAYLTLR